MSNNNLQNQNNNSAEEPLKEKEARKKIRGKIIRWSIFGSIVLAIVITVIVLATTGHSKLIQQIFGNGVINNFIAVPALLIALITLIGSLINKVIWYESLVSALKAFAGFVILQIGAAVLTGIAGPIMETFEKILGLKTFYLNPYLGWTNTQKVLGIVANATYIISYIVIIGLAINIALVALKRWTNCRSVFVTGHVMFQQASVVAIICYFIIFRSVETYLRIPFSFIFGGIITGCYWSAMSNLTFKPVQQVTNGAGFAVGHQQMLGLWASYNLGKLFNLKKKKIISVDTIQLSKGWKIFEDNLVTSSLLIFIFFASLLLGIYIGSPAAFHSIFASNGKLAPFNIFKGKSEVLMALLLPFVLAVSIQIIISGARMFVGELQRSFIGISQKLIPGSVVAIDIAGVFAFCKNSLIIGFISGAVGDLFAMGILIALVTTKTVGITSIIFVGFIPMFFDNGAIGVFADKSGGWKACVTLAFISGFCVVFGAWLITALGGTYINNGQAYSVWNANGAGAFEGGWDASVLWALIAGLSTIMGPNGAPYVIIIVCFIFLLIAHLTTTGIKEGNSDNEVVMPLRSYLQGKWDNFKSKKLTQKI